MSNNKGGTLRLTLENIQTPYNEDEFVGLVTNLYELLIKIAYLGRDQITWPPGGGHAINEDLCRELQIKPEVVSLMKRLPYVDGDFRYCIHLYPQSEPLSYLQDDDVERSRDPDGGPGRLRRDYILPCDIPLTAPGDEGPYLVLDVGDMSDTIRVIPWDEDPEDINPDGWELERPDDPRYYRNYYPQHAPSFFHRFMEKIETLEVIPSGCEQFERQYYGSELPEIRDPAMRVLIETYGWPDSFRQGDWERDVEEVWDGIIRQALD
ncbi:hypothetical protein VMCG_10809 [Cytospora schulzeri]|uniref:Uncharacterized protein n=1 Tax=Cytospora schulzeri TaxID=448051 RepID=A0A423V7S9_9PEZI|nr:hypothetical protein VMCG_10809 [Valsa malicola]